MSHPSLSQAAQPECCAFCLVPCRDVADRCLLCQRARCAQCVAPSAVCPLCTERAHVAMLQRALRQRGVDPEALEREVDTRLTAFADDLKLLRPLLPTRTTTAPTRMGPPPARAAAHPLVVGALVPRTPVAVVSEQKSAEPRPTRLDMETKRAAAAEMEHGAVTPPTAANFLARLQAAGIELRAGATVPAKALMAARRRAGLSQRLLRVLGRPHGISLSSSQGAPVWRGVWVEHSADVAEGPDSDEDEDEADLPMPPAPKRACPSAPQPQQ